MEVWKDIPGYEGYYQASSLGRVKRIKGKVFRKATYRNRATYILRQEKLLSIKCNNKGYPCTVLTRDGKERKVQVHRVVAFAFIPQIKGKPRINHKNGVKIDNRIENLEWCSDKENRDHAVKNGWLDIKGERNGQAVLTEEKVLAIRSEYKKGGITYRKIMNKYNVSYSTVYRVLKSIYWKHI